ncbi:hypothetical protein CO701_18900 [Citrobacter werkmanii]|nr:hypothetical protein [Citrobacter werkmanii]ATF51039.1 hypothetical protein CO701_18900 [Citrobacter werkmanii]
MNEKTVAEESRAWEKERIEKEKIRLRKEQAENRTWIKNKLKWLNKEPRAAFFHFFYLALYFEKFRGAGAFPEVENHVNPLSQSALGGPPLNLAIDQTPGQQPEKMATLGVIASTFDFSSNQNKSESHAPESPKSSVKSEENSLLLSHSDKQENIAIDLENFLGTFNVSTLKNQPANGVSFPVFANKITGVQDIAGCIINTLSDFDTKNIINFLRETSKVWTRAQEDFQQAFSWMDIKNEEQCIWVWNTMKNKGVSPPLNPLNNFQRWYFICATFDLWNGWTDEQVKELTKDHKKISQQRLELRDSPCTPQKHKAVLMDELEKAWKMKLGRKTIKNHNAELILPAKIKKKLTKLSVHYNMSESDMMASLIESEYVRNNL